MSHSALFTLMKKGSARLRAGRPGPPRGAVRVSETEYADNLRAIVRAARGRGIAVVFLEMPVNLPLMPALPKSSLERSEELLALGTAGLTDGELRNGGSDAGTSRGDASV